MKLFHVDFDEWADINVDFAASEVLNYFSEHSFLCPIFCERGDMRARKKEETNDEYKVRLKRESMKTTFEGFKRFAFDNAFIENEVMRTWKDSRQLIHDKKLEWEYIYDKNGNRRTNTSGSYMGAPNFPKSSSYMIFFRGGADDSTEKSRTESVNGIRMLPQFIWLKGAFIAKKLQEISYI